MHDDSKYAIKDQRSLALVVRHLSCLGLLLAGSEDFRDLQHSLQGLLALFGDGADAADELESYLDRLKRLAELSHGDYYGLEPSDRAIIAEVARGGHFTGEYGGVRNAADWFALDQVLRGLGIDLPADTTVGTVRTICRYIAYRLPLFMDETSAVEMRDAEAKEFAAVWDSFACLVDDNRHTGFGLLATGGLPGDENHRKYCLRHATAMLEDAAERELTHLQRQLCRFIAWLQCAPVASAAPKETAATGKTPAEASQEETKPDVKQPTTAVRFRVQSDLPLNAMTLDSLRVAGEDKPTSEAVVVSEESVEGVEAEITPAWLSQIGFQLARGSNRWEYDAGHVMLIARPRRVETRRNVWTLSAAADGYLSSADKVVVLQRHAKQCDVLRLLEVVQFRPISA